MQSYCGYFQLDVQFWPLQGMEFVSPSCQLQTMEIILSSNKNFNATTNPKTQTKPKPKPKHTHTHTHTMETHTNNGMD
jgi:hypothetical protein